MNESTIASWAELGLLVIVLILVLSFIYRAAKDSYVTVQQGKVGIITRFGQYKQLASAGLNFKTPFIDKLWGTISLQNQSQELAFEATTSDQSNVHFSTLIVFAAKDSTEETVKRLAFKFVDAKQFSAAMGKTLESIVRTFISSKLQNEVRGLRTEIVQYVKTHIDSNMEDWGYLLLDIQINDIRFGQSIEQSMEQIVATQNMKIAATNEGDALLIRETKAAQARGAGMVIQAQNEATAATERGKAVANFRTEVTAGITASAEQLAAVGLSQNLITFTMWTETLKHMAEVGKGNTFFLDGSPNGMQNALNSINSNLMNASRSVGTTNNTGMVNGAPH